MATLGEKKALAFIGAVLLLGAGARGIRGVRAYNIAHSPGTSQQAATALDHQIGVVDSLRRTGKRKKKTKKGRAPLDGRKKSPPNSAAPDIPDHPDQPVDLDVASKETIEGLKGIGPKLAATIIADREKSGPFRSLEGLQRVRGIGPVLAEKLRPHVTFSGRR